MYEILISHLRIIKITLKNCRCECNSDWQTVCICQPSDRLVTCPGGHDLFSQHCMTLQKIMNTKMKSNHSLFFVHGSMMWYNPVAIGVTPIFS